MKCVGRAKFLEKVECKSKKKENKKESEYNVGMTGLEPAASTSRTWRATNCATSR